MSSNFPPGFDKDFDNKIPPVFLKMLGIFLGIFVGMVLLTALVKWCQKKSDKGNNLAPSTTSGWNCTDQTSRSHQQPTGYAPRVPPYVPREPPTGNAPKPSAITFFRFGELVAATNGFSRANLLGEGGFGSVHRGMLADGRAVAVKQLKAGSVQGESEFRAEVEIISRVHHRHLVSLVGYCIHQHNRLLVYEFVPNNTLDFHLHGCGQSTMPLSKRLKLAIGSAKGLAYLHEDCSPKIIHRDIKAANILLDSNFEAKVADFGLAKLTSETETHVTTRIMGTRGYLAPEYLITGKLTEKSDVYSYGVMLLELITGRQPIAPPVNADDDPRTLADWARPLLTEALQSNNYDSLIDPRLESGCDIDEMERLVVCAAACIRHSARKRPKMGQVVTVLDGGVSLDELNAGVMPGYSNAYSATRGSGNEPKKYREDLKRFRQMVLESGEEQANTDCTSDANGASRLQSPGNSVEIRPLLT